METRQSLIVRLSDPSDSDAWYEFVEVYRPVIIRMGRARGLQHSDAEDLAQGVLASIANAIEKWEPSGKARFRTWLRRITENAILNALTRVKPDAALGSDDSDKKLAQFPGHDGPDSSLLRLEYRRELFRWAAQQVRHEFTEATWAAFWLTAVEDKPVREVEEILGRTRGAIYVSRTRVMQRLVQQIAEFEADEDES